MIWSDHVFRWDYDTVSVSAPCRIVFRSNPARFLPRVETPVGVVCLPEASTLKDAKRATELFMDWKTGTHRSCGDCRFWNRGFYPRPDKPCNWWFHNIGKPLPRGVPKPGEHQCKVECEGWDCEGFEPRVKNCED